jgi:ribose transport system permease protein
VKVISRTQLTEGDGYEGVAADRVDNPEASPSRTHHAMRSLGQYRVIALGLAILIVLTVVFVPQFLTTKNILNVLQQMAIIGVVALGMHFVIVTSGIDLSVGSILEVATVSFAILLHNGTPVWPALLLTLLIGAAFGLVNGVGVVLLRIQPFVMTLGTLAVGDGLALTLTNGAQVQFSVHSSVLEFIGSAGGHGGVFGLSGQFVIFIVLAAIGWLVLRFLPFGRAVYALGGSAETARLSGIRVHRVTVAVYVISGMCAAVAGIMSAATLTVGAPNSGGLTNLNAIAAVVIGGTSLMGGRGSIWGTVAGAFVLAAISNIIILVGFSPFQAEIISGGVIITAVALLSLSASGSRTRRQFGLSLKHPVSRSITKRRGEA